MSTTSTSGTQALTTSACVVASRISFGAFATHSAKSSLQAKRTTGPVPWSPPSGASGMTVALTHRASSPASRSRACSASSGRRRVNPCAAALFSASSTSPRAMSSVMSTFGLGLPFEVEPLLGVLLRQPRRDEDFAQETALAVPLQGLGGAAAEPQQPFPVDPGYGARPFVAQRGDGELDGMQRVVALDAAWPERLIKHHHAGIGHEGGLVLEGMVVRHQHHVGALRLVPLERVGAHAVEAARHADGGGGLARLLRGIGQLGVEAHHVVRVVWVFPFDPLHQRGAHPRLLRAHPRQQLRAQVVPRQEDEHGPFLVAVAGGGVQDVGALDRRVALAAADRHPQQHFGAFARRDALGEAAADRRLRLGLGLVQRDAAVRVGRGHRRGRRLRRRGFRRPRLSLAPLARHHPAEDAVEVAVAGAVRDLRGGPAARVGGQDARPQVRPQRV